MTHAAARSLPLLAPPAQLYFQCKRGMVDMRTRIRGNKGY
jgi:hypothetical protein